MSPTTVFARFPLNPGVTEYPKPEGGPLISSGAASGTGRVTIGIRTMCDPPAVWVQVSCPELSAEYVFSAAVVRLNATVKLLVSPAGTVSEEGLTTAVTPVMPDTDEV